MQGRRILGEEGGGVWALALPDLKKCKKCPFKNNEKSSKSFLFRPFYFVKSAGNYGFDHIY